MSTTVIVPGVITKVTYKKHAKRKLSEINKTGIQPSQSLKKKQRHIAIDLCGPRNTSSRTNTKTKKKRKRDDNEENIEKEAAFFGKFTYTHNVVARCIWLPLENLRAFIEIFFASYDAQKFPSLTIPLFNPNVTIQINANGMVGVTGAKTVIEAFYAMTLMAFFAWKFLGIPMHVTKFKPVNIAATGSIGRNIDLFALKKEYDLDCAGILGSKEDRKSFRSKHPKKSQAPRNETEAKSSDSELYNEDFSFTSKLSHDFENSPFSKISKEKDTAMFPGMKMKLDEWSFTTVVFEGGTLNTMGHKSEYRQYIDGCKLIKLLIELSIKHAEEERIAQEHKDRIAVFEHESSLEFQRERGWELQNTSSIATS